MFRRSAAGAIDTFVFRVITFLKRKPLTVPRFSARRRRLVRQAKHEALRQLSLVAGKVGSRVDGERAALCPRESPTGHGIGANMARDTA